MEEYKSILLDQLENGVLSPLEQFLRDGFHNVKVLLLLFLKKKKRKVIWKYLKLFYFKLKKEKKVFEKSSHELDTSIEKFCQCRKGDYASLSEVSFFFWFC